MDGMRRRLWSLKMAGVGDSGPENGRLGACGHSDGRNRSLCSFNW